jgi:F1F0 ATPase subunit 2
MNDIPAVVASLLGGTLLGTFFFGGLWWTVQKGVSSEHPEFWFLASLLVRTAVILGGFYFAAHGHWSGLVACLIGFLISRLIVVNRFRRAPAEEAAHFEEETTIAPHS